MTTGLPNQAEYTGEKFFVPSSIMSDSLPSVGINFTGSRDTCIAAALGNLFKSEQSPEAQIPAEIEDDEPANSVAKMHGKQDQHSCGCRHEARTCDALTTPCGICGRYPYRQALINGIIEM
jgi:hypothetical protein